MTAPVAGANDERLPMLYKYETHLHTREGSACAHSSGREMAAAAAAAGYAGIIVTDHNWGGNTAIDRSLPWPDFVAAFHRGYEEARAEGERLGLDVFFGWEAGYRGTEFLIYGLDREWMLAHPEIRGATIEEQFRLVSAGGGIVVHAHPFREEAYIPAVRLYPELVHAVEVVNATHSHPLSRSHNNPDFNARAWQYAQKHHFPMSAGSDVHTTGLFGGGMWFPRRLRNCRDFVQALMGGECVRLTDGKLGWDCAGLRAAAAWPAGIPEEKHIQR